MACGQRETITVTHWGVCWKWIFPYPCKKTINVIRYRYDFRPWREKFSWSPFRRSYEGCCGGALFAWSYWTWSPFGTVSGPWVDTTLTYFADSTIGSVENCPFNNGAIG
ncbi:hypothetical protein SAMN05444581_101248 [Methylocapsa palsarum]|uniref:Uncharacterized protein n=2 Tax=Methylocapsa palsarum TaxID=1612308 RepID=A0A1I3W2P7_9HYPH|nr:hypothetical protein SAMN05444581_101248 [Methylocapsa palsarum]